MGIFKSKEEKEQARLAKVEASIQEEKGRKLRHEAQQERDRLWKEAENQKALVAKQEEENRAKIFKEGIASAISIADQNSVIIEQNALTNDLLAIIAINGGMMSQGAVLAVQKTHIKKCAKYINP